MATWRAPQRSRGSPESVPGMGRARCSRQSKSPRIYPHVQRSRRRSRVLETSSVSEVSSEPGGGCFDVGTIFGKERSWKHLPWAPDPSGFEKTLNWLIWLTGGVRRLRFGIAPRPKPRPIGPRRDVGLAGWGQGREARGAAGRLFDTDRLTLTDQK